MKVRAAPAAAGGVTVRERLNHGSELRALEFAKRIGAAVPLEELRLRPFLMGDLRDDLLGEHVERLRRYRDPVELPSARSVEERRAVAEIVARERE